MPLSSSATSPDGRTVSHPERILRFCIIGRCHYIAGTLDPRSCGLKQTRLSPGHCPVYQKASAKAPIPACVAMVLPIGAMMIRAGLKRCLIASARAWASGMLST